MRGQINGLNTTESKEFVEGIRNIEGVNCDYWIQESSIEFKSILTQIIMDFGPELIVSILANYICDFLRRKKEEGRNVSIVIEDINIYQKDTINIVENKINQINETNQNG